MCLKQTMEKNQQESLKVGHPIIHDDSRLRWEMEIEKIREILIFSGLKKVRFPPRRVKNSTLKATKANEKALKEFLD